MQSKVKENDKAIVALQELAEEFDITPNNGEAQSYLDKHTGQVHHFENYIVEMVENGDADEISSHSEWERDLVAEVKVILNDIDGERYVDFPGDYEPNHYEIMSEFSSNYPNERICDDLCRTIRGGGCFRRFREAIARFGIEEEWYSYKHRELLNFAREWCERNNIDCV
jgi:hypothetical protein